MSKHRLHRLKKPITQILFVSILLLPFTNYHLLITDVFAEIPHQMTYQGKLVDRDGNPIDQQTVSVTFKG